MYPECSAASYPLSKRDAVTLERRAIYKPEPAQPTQELQRLVAPQLCV